MNDCNTFGKYADKRTDGMTDWRMDTRTQEVQHTIDLLGANKCWTVWSIRWMDCRFADWRFNVVLHRVVCESSRIESNRIEYLMPLTNIIRLKQTPQIVPIYMSFVRPSASLYVWLSVWGLVCHVQKDNA